MGKIIVKKVITRKPGHLYYVDGQGNVCEAVMARGGRKKTGSAKKEKVAKAGVKKEKGYLYFIDKQGDISRAKMARGRK